MPFKSDKQQRWMWANEPRIAREWTDRYGAKGGGGIMDWVDQGGMKNYLGEQEMVSAPKKWRSGPDSPPTELAYITQPEKDMIMKANIHGSLAGGPNEGPSGIISLDSQGDYTRDRSPGAYDSGPAGDTGGGSSQQNLRDRAMNEKMMKDLLTGNIKDLPDNFKSQTSAPGKLTRKYSDLPEWMNVKTGVDKFGNPVYKRKHMASAYKSYGTPSFFGNLFSRGAPGYRGIKGLPAWGDPTKNYRRGDGPLGKGYYTDMENFGEMRDAFPSFGILGLLKGLFGGRKKPAKDMSQYNKLGLFGEVPEDFEVDEKIVADNVPMARTDRWTDPIYDTDYNEHYTMGSSGPGPWNNFNRPTSNLDRLTGGAYNLDNMLMDKPGGPYDSGYTMDDAILQSNYEDIRGSGGDDITFAEYMENINRRQPDTGGISSVTYNNPVGGVDQFAKEMEALEAAKAGDTVAVNELGGTLQDFYTNRNPGTDANTRFEVWDDNINFNDQASLPGNNLLAEIKPNKLKQLKSLGIFKEGQKSPYTDKDEIRMMVPGLEDATDAELDQIIAGTFTV